MTIIKSSDLATAIIAGGKSSRFGKSKSLEKLNGKRLIDYAILVADKISREKILIGNEDQDFLNTDFHVLRDIIPDCGPIGGIYTALVHINKGWIATIPCDLPFLIPELYKVLWQYRDDKKPTVAVVQNKIESLVALWPSSIAPVLNQFIKGRNLKIKQILANLNSIEVNMEHNLGKFNKNYFFNINFLHDLKEAENRLLIQQHYIEKDVEG
jgi:molybdopterin-guanine dinucleotide biosynthesis protein A